MALTAPTTPTYPRLSADTTLTIDTTRTTVYTYTADSGVLIILLITTLKDESI